MYTRNGNFSNMGRMMQNKSCILVLLSNNMALISNAWPRKLEWIIPRRVVVIQAWSIKRLSTEIQRSALETNLTLDLNLRRGSSISLNQKEVRLSYMADNNKATLQIQCTTTKKISILQSQRLHIPKSDVDKSLLPFTNSSYCLSAVCK